MEFSHSIPVAVAADKVDLADWIFTMTDEQYRACAVGHHAMGIIGGGRRLGIVNVERIAGTLIVQHYATRLAAADQVSFVSEASEGFLLQTVPFRMKVHWDMKLLPAAGGGSALHCAIGFVAPGWVTAAGKLNRNDHFVYQHLIEETAGFARDIAAKSL